MKPLLIAPRLPEDNNVWLFNERRSDALHSALWSQSHAADRRDAELMLFQMKLRDEFKPQGNYIRWMDLHPGADWRAECL